MGMYRTKPSWMLETETQFKTPSGKKGSLCLLKSLQNQGWCRLLEWFLPIPDLPLGVARWF